MPAITFNWIASDRQSTTYYGQLWAVAKAGNVVYALAAKTDSSGVIELYESIDFGTTWSLVDDTCPISTTFLSGDLDFYYGTDGKLRIMYVDPATSGTIQFTQFDIGAGTWSAITNIGGGFSQTQNAPIGGQESAAIFEFMRSDGSRIIAHQATASGGWKRIRILKEIGGAWTSLALLGGSNPHYILFNAIADGSENIHFLVNSYDSDGNANLYHCSIAAADDAVSSLTLIDSDIEDNGTNGQGYAASSASGRADISSDGSTIAFIYGYTTNYGWAGGTGSLKVAIGDLSGDPLIPTWTIETVASNTAKFFSSGESVESAVSFQGGSTLKAYWATFYTSGPNRANIYSSERTAPSTWSSPDTVFAAQSDGSGTIIDIQGFDLLNGYTNGTGILIDHQSDEGSMYTWVGFNGPFGRANNYVSAGGPMASLGKYVGA
jgi:hypothetical protein